ncbi:HTH domain-containing protein [Staphylococcus sp. KG4-1]|nr:HTH domain-containing protein [Staphylococcus sp. KG4-3]MDW8543369.1 HTH domain-containing protein [Staphylococcus sp. KG4-1]MDW8562794.1 HTH domain-containing protein [Staphylococcus sp. KG4-3]
MELSTEFKVSERTIIRDIQEIRNYFYDNDEWIEKKRFIMTILTINTQLKMEEKLIFNYFVT